ncbi:MAG: methylenetetrahydrofolate reductase [Woeseiaceae bacterium]|nr:methylenetetrahydrofolate reductase [Woeseiaceae bacterium]
MLTFRDALREKDVVVTAELPLTPGSSARDIEDSLQALAPVVDAVQISDNRMAAGHASPVAIAALAISNGVDAVPHLSCRDRNRIALRGDILGAAVNGVTSLVVARGEKVPANAAVRAKGVFNGNASELAEFARRVNEESTIVSPPGFAIGTYSTVFAPAPGWEATKLEEKIEAGARFLLTQSCLNTEVLRSYMEAVVARRITHRAAVIVEVPLLTSIEEARSIKEIQPGAPLPEDVVKRIAGSQDPVAAGVEACAEVLKTAVAVPGVSGVNVLHYGEAGTVAEAIRASGLR